MTLLAAGAPAATGCGGDEFANERRPAPTITLSAVISAHRVTVSPSRFGAGTIELLASNQARTSQRLQLRTERLSPGARPLLQTTGPINPGGTARLTAQVAPGSYVVSARSPAIEPARIVVTAPRDSATDRSLQP